MHLYSADSLFPKDELHATEDDARMSDRWPTHRHQLYVCHGINYVRIVVHNPPPLTQSFPRLHHQNPYSPK
jgi:hypothetical protein